MKVIAKTENSELASVFIGDFGNNKYAEFVESSQPPFTKNEKWVLIVSTLFGCPVGCSICDCAGNYKGKLSTDEIFEQIDFLIKLRYSEKKINCGKFKIQFSRMGEPAFNPDVLLVLKEIPFIYEIKNFIPSLSTIAPASCESFFEELLEIKKKLYPNSFQLQFSLHSTSSEQRDILIPVRKWSFKEIADYGSRFFNLDGKKITLNFALFRNAELNFIKLLEYFNPNEFIIKITPVNPTYNSIQCGIESIDLSLEFLESLKDELGQVGYEYIISIGEKEENKIGSNCGQYLKKHLNSNKKITYAYTYNLELS